MYSVLHLAYAPYLRAAAVEEEAEEKLGKLVVVKTQPNSSRNAHRQPRPD